MTMTTIPQIADAVKAAIIASESLPTVTAMRIYLPLAQLKNISPSGAPTVLIVPKADEFALIARDTQTQTVAIDIGVIVKLPSDIDPTAESANTTIDPLVNLCQSIATMFNGQTNAGDAEWFETKYAPLFDAEKLRTDRTFLAVITVTFKLAE